MAQQRGELPLRHAHVPRFDGVVCAAGGDDAVIVLAPVDRKHFLQTKVHIVWTASRTALDVAHFNMKHQLARWLEHSSHLTHPCVCCNGQVGPRLPHVPNLRCPVA